MSTNRMSANDIKVYDAIIKSVGDAIFANMKIEMEIATRYNNTKTYLDDKEWIEFLKKFDNILVCILDGYKRRGGNMIENFELPRIYTSHKREKCQENTKNKKSVMRCVIFGILGQRCISKSVAQIILLMPRLENYNDADRDALIEAFEDFARYDDVITKHLERSLFKLK
jgi:hypothetical protein